MILECLSAVAKSSFGSYVLWYALRQHPPRKVIYVSEKTRNAWVFVPNASGEHEVVAFKKADFELRQELDDASTVLISDSIRPPQVNAFTIMITSPRRDRWWEFFKIDHCKRLIFPPFTLAEILEMRATCFADVSVEEASSRYAQAGGIPRAVFGKTMAEIEAQQERALHAVNLNKLATSLSTPEIESDERQSHRIIIMLPRGSMPPGDAPLPWSMAFYQPWRTELASRIVEHKVYQQLMANSASSLNAILAQPPSVGHMSVIYKAIYEGAALEKLSQGGDFPCFDVKSCKESSITLPAANVEYFRYVKDLREVRSKPTILVPSSGSFTAIDAVLQDGSPANVTINVEHDLKLRGRGARGGEGLIPVADTLGLRDTITMSWVLPEERYDVLRRAAVQAKQPSSRSRKPDATAVNAKQTSRRNNKQGGVATTASQSLSRSSEKADADTSVFDLVLPEEANMTAKLDELKDAADELEKLSQAAAHADSTATAQQKDTAAASAAAALAAHKMAVEAKRPEWQRLKDRVQHRLICLQFSNTLPAAPRGDSSAARIAGTT